jgi:nicotinic acid mononucleotide adenylyltransferase
VKRLKQFITELAVADVSLNKGKKDAGILLGRFQPPTLGHKKLYDQAKRSGVKIIIAPVHAAKSNAKSPIPFSVQQKMLKAMMPDAEILKVQTGFIGEFVDGARKKGLEPKILFAGADRAGTYQAQIKSYTDKLDLDLKVKKIARPAGAVSATMVRDAIKNDDEKEFQKLTDKSVHKYYKQLKKYIK